MFKVEIQPDWILRQPDGRTVALPVLLNLLASVRSLGSISQAATACGISYRHAWGLLREFNEQFGAELVVKSRGQGTVLSPLADKLIWADKRISARLTPLLDSLASELQQELASLLAERPPTLRLTASHGFAVAALVKQLEQQGVMVDLQYRSSTEAVAALARGECDLAGFHLPVGELETAAAAKYLPWLDPGRHMLIHLAYRMQGIFAARGNPKDIRALDDLARPDIRFVNRQRGSGTRLLLELLLAGKGIRPEAIHGFDSAEFTHAAVAAYVASNMADASFGVETAARRFDLDFVPVIRERYFFACAREAPAEPLMAAALAVMESAEFKSTLAGLPGYDGALSGQRLELQSLF
ncbi:substrate-binding domain-containing protein [Duganella sp. Dugasp56]|uniref:substrate-binding domain-containing protein n=1 Tax=Duganella sp. Dugasp56 TaxID=3243046 RepID=UPI0039B123EB